MSNNIFEWNNRAFCRGCGHHVRCSFGSLHFAPECCPVCGADKSSWTILSMRMVPDRGSKYVWWKPWTWDCPGHWEVRVSRHTDDSELIGVMGVEQALQVVNADMPRLSDAARSREYWARFAGSVATLLAEPPTAPLNAEAFRQSLSAAGISVAGSSVAGCLPEDKPQGRPVTTPGRSRLKRNNT